MQKNKTGEAMKMLNAIHAHFTSALLNYQIPDFKLIDELKIFCEAQDQVTEIEQCLNCRAVLALNKSLYVKVFINQINICSGNGEEINTRLANNEVYLCNNCGSGLVNFVKSSDKEKNV